VNGTHQTGPARWGGRGSLLTRTHNLVLPLSAILSHFFSALATVTVQTKHCHVQEIAESLHISCSVLFTSSMWKYRSWVRQKKRYCYCSLSADMEADLEFLLCSYCLCTAIPCVWSTLATPELPYSHGMSRERERERERERKGNILFSVSRLLWILEFQNHFKVLSFRSSFIVACFTVT